MNCVTCGGKLRFEENIYVCENCGTKQQPETIFENIDVFICYIETDEQGRRTKDSIMAQEIYNKLQNVGVNVFYQRISISELIDEEFKKVRQIAQNKAKIIILCATSKENFEKIFEENKECFTDKKIIPVYSSVSAYDMPKELSKLQSVNFDNIGSISDLSKNILIMLERENEIDVVKIINKQTKKRKILNMILMCSLFIILVVGIISSIIYFSKKDDEITKNLDDVIKYENLSENEKYRYAEDMMNNGKYLEAVNIFSTLGNYKNSKNHIKKIYDKYDGYYIDDNNEISLHIQIDSNSVCNIEIGYKYNTQRAIISCSAILNFDQIKFSFKDNYEKTGTGKIILKNNEIELHINFDTTEANSPSFYNKFKLSNKSDYQIMDTINYDKIQEWFSSPKQTNDFMNMGYNLIYSEHVYKADQLIFQIENNDVYLITFDHKYTSEIEEQKNRFILGLKAPAYLIAPEYIGQELFCFEKNEIFYQVEPLYFDLAEGIHYGSTKNTKNAILIEKDTMIGATPKTWVSERNWKHLMENKELINIGANEPPQINYDLIMKWLKEGVSKDELLKQGFEVEELYEMFDGGIEYMYGITNTEIKIACIKDEYSENGEGQVSGILVPASIIIPDKLGANNRVILEDDILYVPNGYVGMGVRLGDAIDAIEGDTMVAVTSRELVESAYGDIGKTLEDIIEGNFLFTYNKPTVNYDVHGFLLF